MSQPCLASLGCQLCLELPHQQARLSCSVLPSDFSFSWRP